MVGAGELKPLEVFFSIPEERRVAPLTEEDRLIVETFGAHALGEMYERLRAIEIRLHAAIRRTLQEQYGSDESGWWRTAVPLAVRQKLQMRREQDTDLAEPYTYTDLLDLAEILEKNWAAIAGKVITEPAQRKEILSGLRRLNQIRRKVLHPVRSTPPSDSQFESEFRFVCEFSQKLVAQQ
jgi:hypothetical protein